MTLLHQSTTTRQAPTNPRCERCGNAWSYVERLEAEIERYRTVLEGIQRTDKTPLYAYPKTTGRQPKAVLNRDGMVPGPGSRWQTPREAASWALRNL